MDYETKSILIQEILCDEDFNCRGKIVPIDVAELMGSIAKYGLLQPITVQPYTGISGKLYRIICGHRRFVAMKLLSKSHIPCMIKEGLTELQARTINFIENLKRANLNILQEAKALMPYKEAGWKNEEIGSEVGMSRGWVEVRMCLLALPEDVQSVAAAGILTTNHIRNLYTLRGDKDQMYAAVRLIKERNESKSKVPINLIKKPQKPFRKELRTPEEIYEMQEILRNNLGNSLVTVMLGWAAGVVNDYEAHREIRDTAALMNRIYVIPKEVLP